MTHRTYLTIVSVACTVLLAVPIFAQSTKPNKATKRTKAQKPNKKQSD